jgi:hypothetical protein
MKMDNNTKPNTSMGIMVLNLNEVKTKVDKQNHGLMTARVINSEQRKKWKESEHNSLSRGVVINTMMKVNSQ